MNCEIGCGVIVSLARWCGVLSEDECVDTVSKGENGVGFIVWGFDERSYSM